MAGERFACARFAAATGWQRAATGRASTSRHPAQAQHVPTRLPCPCSVQLDLTYALFSLNKLKAVEQVALDPADPGKGPAPAKAPIRLAGAP